MGRRTAHQVRRRKLFEGQDGLCCYCEGAMRLLSWPESANQPGDMATYEHVVQKARGGPTDLDNGKAACAGCNVGRPDGLNSQAFAQLRQALLDRWPACTHLPPELRKTVLRAVPPAPPERLAA